MFSLFISPANYFAGAATLVVGLRLIRCLCPVLHVLTAKARRNYGLKYSINQIARHARDWIYTKLNNRHWL